MAEFNATKVVIDGKNYTVEKIIHSISRGEEYLLSSETEKNCRTCKAASVGVVLRSSSEFIHYK